MKLDIQRLQKQSGIIGTSEKILEVIGMIGQVAPVDISVLVTGESGTGKEVMARAIHKHSKRSSLPMVTVNCGAIPENLIEEEVKVLSQGMTEDEVKKNKKNFEEKAKTRIKTGLILNEFGEKNQIKVTEQEIQAEVQKQLRMMPGQEKMVMDFYQKNPSALASLRGTVYEEKILNLIKEKGKANKKDISKDEAEKILKEANKQAISDNQKEKKRETKKKPTITLAKEKKRASKKVKSKSAVKKTKKVSKK